MEDNNKNNESTESTPEFLSTFDIGEMCSMDEGASFGPVTAG